MKVAFVGKGGSGKTTLAALFCRFLAEQSAPIVAIDADINQHLGESLGLADTTVAAIPPLGHDLERIKDYLRGSNPRIPSAALMTKTTPPGHGSRLWRVRESNPLFAHFAHEINGVTLLVTGSFREQDVGVKCYHANVGAVELLLNHCLDEPDTYTVVDMTAGVDAFASGLFAQFDLTFLVVEPTKKSLGVYQQYQTHAHRYGVPLQVIGNKLENDTDLAFVRTHTGAAMATWLTRSAYVRAMEQGQVLPLLHLEPENREALATMRRVVDTCTPDAERSYRLAVALHRQNASAWMNNTLGTDVTQQIDPEFSFSTALAARSGANLSVSDIEEEARKCSGLSIH